MHVFKISPGQKVVGQTSWLAHWEQKVGGQLPALPNRLRRQCLCTVPFGYCGTGNVGIFSLIMLYFGFVSGKTGIPSHGSRWIPIRMGIRSAMGWEWDGNGNEVHGNGN